MRRAVLLSSASLLLFLTACPGPSKIDRIKFGAEGYIMLRGKAALPRGRHEKTNCGPETLCAALKQLLPDQSWSQVRQLIAGRRVLVNGNLCLDEGRKVKAGEVLKLVDHALAPPATAADVKLVRVDEHLLVVQKPAGVTTLRHREETDLPVMIADDPQTCVVLGTGKALDQLDTLKGITIT